MIGLIHRLIGSFSNAFRGVLAVANGEMNFRIHLLAMIVVVCFAAAFKVEFLEWCALLICIGIVLTAECFNTAIEKLCDRVTKEQDPLIRDCKDIAAGAVLISAVFSAIVAGLIFIPKVLH